MLNTKCVYKVKLKLIQIRDGRDQEKLHERLLFIQNEISTQVGLLDRYIQHAKNTHVMKNGPTKAIQMINVRPVEREKSNSVFIF